MQIDIQARGFSLTPGLREHTERRLRFAFGSTQDRVGRVAVRLTDDNGPRGGADKRCHVRVNVRGAPGIVIEDTDPDLYVAISRTVDRVGRTVARRLARLREDRRDGVPAFAVGRAAPMRSGAN